MSLPLGIRNLLKTLFDQAEVAPDKVASQWPVVIGTDTYKVYLNLTLWPDEGTIRVVRK